jgi:hypothetical protein
MTELAKLETKKGIVDFQFPLECVRSMVIYQRPSLTIQPIINPQPVRGRGKPVQFFETNL